MIIITAIAAIASIHYYDLLANGSRNNIFIIIIIIIFNNVYMERCEEIGMIPPIKRNT